MNIIVCVKYVPITQQVDLRVNGSKTDLCKDDLTYAINEWDNYAVEEALLLVEKFGGITTAITVGEGSDGNQERRKDR